jgi:hypothetical protein
MAGSIIWSAIQKFDGSGSVYNEHNENARNQKRLNAMLVRIGIVLKFSLHKKSPKADIIQLLRKFSNETSKERRPT